MNARVKLILGITFFFLVFLGTIAYFSIKRLEGDTQWIDHSHQIIHSLQKTYADLKEAQTNYAEFLLTQKNQYSSACESSMDKLGGDILQADNLATGDPILQKNMDQLRSLIENKSASMREGLAYVKAGRTDLAVKPIQTEEVKKTDREVKNLVDQMSGVQIWLLKSRQAFEQAGTQKNVRFMVVGTLLALLACGLAGYSINRYIHERQEALNNLKSSEEKFRFLAESANDAFITTDSGGKISDVNPAGETLFGYSKEELGGKPLSLLLPPKPGDEPGGIFFGKFAAMTPDVKTLELSGRKKDGTELPLELSLSQWKTREGVFYTTIIRDIMERKFFIKTLLNNEHRLFQFLDAIPVGVLVRDPSGAPYYANQKAKEIFGQDIVKAVPPGKMSTESGKLFVSHTGEPYPADKLPSQLALTGLKSHVDDMEVRTPDGKTYLEAWGAPILDENGLVKFSLASFIDVTHQKQITESLKEREEFFRNLFEEGPIGMTLTFSDGIMVNVNRAFSDMLGRPKSELVGHSYLDFTFPDDRAVDQSLTQKLFERILPRYQVEKRFVTKKGEILWCKVSASVIRDLNDEPLFRLAIVENITDQKSSEMVLKESEEKFRTLTESANDAIISADSKGLVIFFNPTAEKIFGYSRDEILGRPISQLMAEASWKKNFALIQNYLATGEATIPGRTFELTGRRKSGQEFPAQISYFSWKTSSGLFFTSIMRDITEQKEAETALRESEERFRSVTDSANDAIVSADSNGNIIYSNVAATRLFGYSIREMYGRSLTSLLSEKSLQGHEDEFRKAFAGGASPLVGRNTEWVGKSKDGRDFPLDLSLYTWLTDAGVFVTALLRDITERKQIEEMKDDLISVVSHQLKTPVAEINGYIENMLDGLAGSLQPKQREYLEDMREIGMENYRLISDLLSLSKIERGVITVNLQPVSLRQILESSIRDYEDIIRRKGLQLIQDMEDGEIMVETDAEKTVETIRNIVNNAIKCTDRGAITLKIRSEGSFGVIEVRDTGIGMSPETLGRLFTKERVMGAEAARAGAGLGLYIAKNFMELQKGGIGVVSEVGKGSSFFVKIPKVKGAVHV